MFEELKHSNLVDLEVQSMSTYSARTLSLTSRSSHDFVVPPDFLAQYDTVIKSFCPNILLSALANTKGLFSRSDQFSGACILADISGFSKLSRLLGEVGGDGLDDLRKRTSRFLSKFIYIVYTFGGDVVSFAGDALICIFPSTAVQSPYHCKRNAIECGLILKDLCTDRLMAHIAVSFGDMCFSILGGFSNDWVYTVSGPCVQQLSDCIEEARPMELVVTAECFDLPEAYLDLLCYERTSLGNMRIQSISASSTGQLPSTQCFVERFDRTFNDDADFTLGILSFVPTPVVSSLTAGSFKTISELREVTTVFVKLDSYDPRLHADLSALQPFVLIAQEGLSLTGGVLRQFLVDDKGCVLIALWGVPSASYANNAHRAVVFSDTLAKAAKRIGHSCSIGIASGKAFCGAIGSILRRDYVAMGDCVNMAARLMSKANGRILLDPGSFASLPSSARGSLQPAESMILKGRIEPMQPYFLQARGPSVGGCTGTQDESLRGFDGALTLTAEISASTVMCPLLLQKMKFSGEDISQANDATSSEHGSNLCPHVKERLDELTTKLKALHVNVVRQDSKCSISLPSKREVPHTSYVVVEGLAGSGKTEVAKYFRHLSYQNKVRCFYVSALSEDRFVEYGVFRKLFVALVGKETFTSVEDQKQTIISLLHLTYPHMSNSSLLRKKFPMLKEVLQLSWCLKLDKNGAFSAMPMDSMPLVGRLHSECRSIFPKHGGSVADVLHTLLSEIPASIVIDDAHHCDSMTWKELSQLTTLKLPVVLLLTALPSAISRSNGVVKLGLSIPQLSTEGVVAADMNNCMPLQIMPRWLKRRQAHVTPLIPVAGLPESSRVAEPQLIAVHSSGSVLRLNPLCITQIRVILMATLGNVEEDLVRLVSEFSSGNASWVVLITSYISEFGLSAFMDSVGVVETGPERPVSGSNNDAVVGYGASSTVMSCAADKTFSSLSARRKYDLVPPQRRRGDMEVQYDSVLLRNYVVSRIDLLAPSEQIVLKHAAVMGVRFYENVLQDVVEAGIFPRGKDASSLLRAALQALQERSFIVQRSATEHTYEFHNSRIREIVYDLTPPSNAWGIHLRVARSMEQRFASITSTIHLCEALAYHYHMAVHEQTSVEGRESRMRYAVCTAAGFLELGSLETAVGYLQHAEGVATSLDGCRQIVKLVLSALKRIETTDMQSEHLTETYSTVNSWAFSDSSHVRQARTGIGKDSNVDVGILKGLHDIRDRLFKRIVLYQLEDNAYEI